MASKIIRGIPLNRVEGDLEIKVEVTDGVVTNAWSCGTMFRGFERILPGRGAMDGLVIENQGFVSGNGEGGSAFPEQPSDDPTTPAVDDPTRNVVGNLPLLYTQKTVEIFTGSNIVREICSRKTIIYNQSVICSVFLL